MIVALCQVLVQCSAALYQARPVQCSSAVALAGGITMDGQGRWSVRYVTDSGKSLTLDQLFLCKNCEVVEEQVSELSKDKAGVNSLIFEFATTHCCWFHRAASALA